MTRKGVAFSAVCANTEGLAPVDLLLLMAARENDAPKVAELLRAGANTDIKVWHFDNQNGQVFCGC